MIFGKFFRKKTKTKTKSQPSGMPFFVMEKMNWGLQLRSETNRTIYYVYSDGQVEWQYNGCTNSLSLEKRMLIDANDYWSDLYTRKMEDYDFRELCKLLEKFPQENARHDCLDGVGYEMTQYDENGKIIHKTTGYIYGNNTLESIRTVIEKGSLFES